MFRNIVVVTLVLLIVHSPLCSQQSNTGNWLMYFGNQSINKKWNWWNEVQYRNYNFIGDLEQFIVRTGIGYNLTENNNNLLLGYAFIQSQPYVNGTDTKLNIRENRLYQQFITRQQFGRIYLQHRYRLEERFLPNSFRVRFRYFISANIALNKPSIVQNCFYLSAYNEIFLHSNSPVFDRNRVYTALGYAVNKNVRIETGFMYQVLEKSHRPQFQLAIFNNLPLSNFH